MAPGHLLIDHRCAILEADEAFGRMMHREPESLRGCDVLSLTAAADRDECTRAIGTLVATRRPFDIVKRFVREDASVLWVRNSVSMMRCNGDDLIVATCAPVADRNPRQAPAALLNTARLQVAMVEERGRICDAQLLSGPSWQALLHVYIAEAEGRSASIADLAGRVGQSPEVLARWIKLLSTNDVLDVETANTDPSVAKCYRLTATAAERLEAYLTKFGRSTIDEAEAPTALV
jgi:hypothetical protein